MPSKLSAAMADLWEEAKFRLQKPKPIEVKLKGRGSNLKVFFNFSPHAEARHAQALGPILQEFKPHVVCIEQAMAFEESASLIEEFYSAPKKHAKAKYDDPFEEALHAVLIKHKPRVFVLERFPLQESLNLHELESYSRRFGANSFDSFFKGNSQDALGNARLATQARIKIEQDRESHVKQNLGNLRELLVRRFPELAKERELRVVVNYGAAHTPLYRDYKRTNMTVGRHIPMPFYYLRENSTLRRGTFGKQSEITDKELARDMLSSIIVHHLKDVNSPNAMAFANLVTRSISLDAFHSISKALSQRKRPYAAVASVLEQHGIPIPMTKYGVHKFLRQRRIPLSHE